MPLKQSDLIRGSYRLYALAELKDACGKLIGQAPAEAPVKARPMWLRGALTEVGHAKKREVLRNMINQELGSILKDHPDQVRGLRPMNVDQLGVLTDEVLEIVMAQAEVRSVVTRGELLAALEPSLGNPNSTESLLISDALHNLRSGVDLTEVAKQVVNFAPVPVKAQFSTLEAAH